MFAFSRFAAIVVLCSALASCTGSPDHPTTSPTRDGSPLAIREQAFAAVTRYSDEFCAYGVPETGCPPGQIPPALRRPLELPGLKPGHACPVSTDHVVSPRFGPAMGDGPVKAVTPPSFRLAHPAGLFDTNLEMHKVLWLFHATYQGPVLIRGVGLAHASLIGFALGTGGKPFPELWIPPRSDWAADRLWVDLPSEVLFDGPGCYGLQIDTRLGSDVIVMLARRPA